MCLTVILPLSYIAGGALHERRSSSNARSTAPLKEADRASARSCIGTADRGIEEVDIQRRIREFLNAGYRDDHSKSGPLALDVPLHDEIRYTCGPRDAAPQPPNLVFGLQPSAAFDLAAKRAAQAVDKSGRRLRP